VQGRGYGSEAVGALVRYLFAERGKHKVCADCDTRNAASWRLLERLGFRREGELRESFRDGSTWADDYVYGLLASEWAARR
jgi:RimJ/RimL family protein N-acetyltransferase